MLQLALKLQKRENFSVISEMLLFTNQAQGDRSDPKHEFHQGIDS